MRSLIDVLAGHIVRLRLGRMPTPNIEAAVALCNNPPQPIAPPLSSLPQFEPIHIGHNKWQAESPWPEMTLVPSRNSRWIATRIPAQNTRVDEPKKAVIFLHGWLSPMSSLPFYKVLTSGLAQRGIEVT